MPNHKDDWFRSAKWDKESQELFEAKLSRSKSSYHKVQYLWTKAVNLADANNFKVAETLYLRIVHDYPDEDQIVWVYEDLGKLYEKIEDYKKAEEYYRKCIIQQQTHTSIYVIHSYFYLANLIVKTKEKDKYSEAEKLLNEHFQYRKMIFNSEIYNYFVVRAILAARMGKNDHAKACAKKAIETAEAGLHSQFPRHPKIGLVAPNNSSLKLMKDLADIA